MLTRQKILLLMLKCAGRTVQRVELMKWCFLLRHQSESEGGSSFYDFVPYKYGPFSFALYQEIGRLQEQSYVLSEGEQAWRVNGELVDAASGLGSKLEHDVRTLVERFAQLPTNCMIDYVYENYPDYTVNSEKRKLATRPRADVAVYTAGYERLSVDRFLKLMIDNGICRVIDVRNNPVSRRYGFHKSTLSRLTNKLSIEYFHFPQLGIQSEKRGLFPIDANRGLLFDEYENTTLAIEVAAVKRVAQLVRESPSVLFCLESNPACCHRSRLAYPVAALTGLPIIHLRSET